MQEVVALEELIGEFGEREAVAGFAVEAALHAVLGHHVVHCDVLSYFSGEVEERIAFHPVIVVHEFGGIGCVAVEVEEAAQLFLDASHVVAQRFFVEQVALGALARGVANHACGTSHQGEGLVAGALEVAEHHHTAQVAYVQAVGRGVYAEISGSHALVEHFLGSGHHLVEHAAPPEFVYKVHIRCFLFVCRFLQRRNHEAHVLLRCQRYYFFASHRLGVLRKRLSNDFCSVCGSVPQAFEMLRAGLEMHAMRVWRNGGAMRKNLQGV